jgi:hypothetical protein
MERQTVSRELAHDGEAGLAPTVVSVDAIHIEMAAIPSREMNITGVDPVPTIEAVDVVVTLLRLSGPGW